MFKKLPYFQNNIIILFTEFIRKITLLHTSVIIIVLLCYTQMPFCYYYFIL